MATTVNSEGGGGEEENLEQAPEYFPSPEVGFLLVTSWIWPLEVSLGVGVLGVRPAGQCLRPSGRGGGGLQAGITTTLLTPTPSTYLFPHERLQAWRQARSFYLLCAQLQGLPRASGHAGDQLERAALSVLLNLVEGAGRTSWKEKRHFFSIALGSLAEAVAVVDVAATRGLIEGAQADRAIAAGRKVGSMLAGLLKVQGP
jgi:four helix bundle protein